MNTHTIASPTPVHQSHAASSDRLRLSVVRPADEVFSTWRTLEARLNTVPLAASAAWNETWIEHYADLVPTQVMLATADQTTCGACLITEGVGRNAGPIPINTRHIGTAGEPDTDSVCVEYNGLLIDAAFRSAFASELAESTLNQRGVDELCLDGFSIDEFTAWENGSINWEQHRRPSRFFDLQAARDADQEIIDRLGRSTRSNVRRLLRKYGEIDLEWAASVDDADDIFQELVELHQARWQATGQRGAFASERFLNFQRDLIARLHPQGRVILFRVSRQGETVGCLMLLVDRGRLLDYLSGFAPFEIHPSPGIVTHYLCLREALQRGYAAYDFLVGDKRHKENLSTDSQDLIWAVTRRRNWKNGLVGALRGLKRLHRRRSAV